MSQNLFPVLIILPGIIVGMCIKYHINKSLLRQAFPSQISHYKSLLRQAFPSQISY
jgi:hypothetical protein